MKYFPGGMVIDRMSARQWHEQKISLQTELENLSCIRFYKDFAPMGWRRFASAAP
jgi:hypothetical protein